MRALVRKALTPLLAAACIALTGPAAAQQGQTSKLSLDMIVGNDTYSVQAEPYNAWQLASEGAISLDQKFDIQPDGSGGLIQIKLANLGGNKPPNPCIILQGLVRTFPKGEIRVSPGRKPQTNLMPVCSMIAESTLKTRFYYSAVFVTGELLVAGIAANDRDLTDTQINEFSRYLVSIQAVKKDATE